MSRADFPADASASIEELGTVGGGRLDELSRVAGPGSALLATERGVVGLVRWDAESGADERDMGSAGWLS